MTLNIPWLVGLLEKIYNLILGIAGYDDEVFAVFDGLMKFFGA